MTGEDHEWEEICGRADRHLLAHICRLRERRDRGGISAGRYRSRRRLAGLRAQRCDHGLCDRPCFGLSSQSCGNRGSCGGWTFPRQPDSSLRDRAGCRSRGGCSLVVCHRQRRCRLRRCQRFCLERLRRSLAGQIQPGGWLHDGSGYDHDVPVHHHGLDTRQGAGGLCAASDRARAGDDPPRQHSRDQHIGESGAQHRAGIVRWRMGDTAVVAVLAGAADWRCSWRRDLSLAE